MPITKETEIQYEVLPDGTLQERVATFFVEDGVRSPAQYHRAVLTPDTAVTALTGRAKAIAQAVWTPDVVQKYKDRQQRLVRQMQQQQQQSADVVPGVGASVDEPRRVKRTPAKVGRTPSVPEAPPATKRPIRPRRPPARRG